jgi:NADPH:quinone reductase
MRAAQIVRLDGPEAVTVGTVDDPVAGPDHVLIEVHAAGVCYPDVLLTRGQYQYKPDPPFVPGAEVAGVVVQAPDGSPLAPGDRVAAFSAFGGYAELAAVAAPFVFPLPAGLSFAEGAGLPMNYLTAHFALVRRAALQPGDTVLVHGAGGGVGTASLQLAAALGARTIAVVSAPEKAAIARQAGAHDVVLAEGFLAAVKELTGGRGADIVVDPVGGDRFTDSLRSLAPEGRLLVIGFTGGEIPTVKVNRLLLNNISVTGVGWGAFALPRPEYLAEQWRDLLPHLESGALRPPLAPLYTLDDAGAAIAQLDSRQAAGKVVIQIR